MRDIEIVGKINEANGYDISFSTEKGSELLVFMAVAFEKFVNAVKGHEAKRACIDIMQDTLDELEENLNKERNKLLTKGFVQLPVKPGDVIYKMDINPNGIDCSGCDSFDSTAYECRKTKNGLRPTECVKYSKHTVKDLKEACWYIYSDSVGKTVFLNPEDLMKAKEELKNEYEV